MRFILLIFYSIFLVGCKNTFEKNSISKSSKPFQDSVSINQKLLLDLEIRSALENYNCPGACILIIKDTMEFHSLEYGLRSSEDTFKIDKKTIFRIGSLSKGFAGILAARLVNTGKLNLNAPVSYYLPDFKLKSKPAKDSIRVWHLLSHSTGLTEHAFSNLIDLEKDKTTILNALNRISPRDSTGKTYAYQNACFSVIEDVIARVTGLSYEQAVQQYIFTPLGMHDSSFGYDSLINAGNKAIPHKFDGGANRFVPISLHKAYYNTPAAGGINSNLNDMAKWLKALCGKNENIISSKDRELAFKKNIYTSWDDKYYNTWEHADSSYYGLGWRRIRLNEMDIVFHGGQVNSYRCEIAFNQKKGTGVIALFNSPCDVSNTIVPLVFSVLR